MGLLTLLELSISFIQCKSCIHFIVYAFSHMFSSVFHLLFVVQIQCAVLMGVSVVLKVWYPWGASRWQVRYLSGIALVAGRSQGEDLTWVTSGGEISGIGTQPRRCFVAIVDLRSIFLHFAGESLILGWSGGVERMFALYIDCTVLCCGVFVAAHRITVLIGQLAASVVLRPPCWGGGTGCVADASDGEPLRGSLLLM